MQHPEEMFGTLFDKPRATYADKFFTKKNLLKFDFHKNTICNLIKYKCVK